MADSRITNTPVGQAAWNWLQRNSAPIDAATSNFWGSLGASAPNTPIRVPYDSTAGNASFEGPVGPRIQGAPSFAEALATASDANAPARVQRLPAAGVPPPEMPSFVDALAAAGRAVGVLPSQERSASAPAASAQAALAGSAGPLPKVVYTNPNGVADGPVSIFDQQMPLPSIMKLLSLAKPINAAESAHRELNTINNNLLAQSLVGLPADSAKWTNEHKAQFAKIYTAHVGRVAQASGVGGATLNTILGGMIAGGQPQ